MDWLAFCVGLARPQLAVHRLIASHCTIVISRLVWARSRDPALIKGAERVAELTVLPYSELFSQVLLRGTPLAYLFCLLKYNLSLLYACYCLFGLSCLRSQIYAYLRPIVCDSLQSRGTPSAPPVAQFTLTMPFSLLSPHKKHRCF